MHIPIIYNELGEISDDEISKYIHSKNSSFSYNIKDPRRKGVKNNIHHNSTSVKLVHRKKSLGKILIRNWDFSNQFQQN